MWILCIYNTLLFFRAGWIFFYNSMTPRRHPHTYKCFDITWPVTYTRHVHASINRKQIAYSAAGCLVAGGSNNSLRPAHVGNEVSNTFRTAAFIRFSGKRSSPTGSCDSSVTNQGWISCDWWDPISKGLQHRFQKPPFHLFHAKTFSNVSFLWLGTSEVWTPAINGAF